MHEKHIKLTGMKDRAQNVLFNEPVNKTSGLHQQKLSIVEN